MSGVDPTGRVIVIPGGGGGGGSHTAGTFAARPGSPTAGDTYEVTSGDGLGDHYQCFVDGAWTRTVQARIVFPASAQLRYDLTVASGTVTNAGAASSANLTAPVTTALARLAPTGRGAALMPGNSGGVTYTVLTGAGGYLPTTAMSLSLWFRRDSTDVGQVIACKAYRSGAWGGPAASTFIWINGSGLLEGYVYDGTDVGAVGPSPTVGVWHHVALTWDGRYLRLYLDGELVKTTDRGSGGHSITAHASPGQWGFGGQSEASLTAQQFRGAIGAPIVVTSTTRTDAEIAAEFQRGLGWPLS